MLPSTTALHPSGALELSSSPSSPSKSELDSEASSSAASESSRNDAGLPHNSNNKDSHATGPDMLQFGAHRLEQTVVRSWSQQLLVHTRSLIGETRFQVISAEVLGMPDSLDQLLPRSEHSHTVETHRIKKYPQTSHRSRAGSCSFKSWMWWGRSGLFGPLGIVSLPSLGFDRNRSPRLRYIWPTMPVPLGETLFVINASACLWVPFVCFLWLWFARVAWRLRQLSLEIQKPFNHDQTQRTVFHTQ